MRLPDPPAGLNPGDPVWIYLRYSSEHQTIESQAHTMQQWCALHNLTIAREWRDEARSGKTDAGRGGFTAMIAAVEHGDARNVKAVLFWSFARMARNTNDAEYFKSLLRKRGLIVFTLADDIPQGALAPVFEAFKHVQDADYRKRLSDEIKRGLEYRVSKGVPHTGGKIPFGYMPGERVYLGPKMKRVNGVLKQVGERYGHRLAQDPQTRERVALAWRMMLDGATDYQIFQRTHVVKNYAAIGHFFNSVTYAGAVRFGEYINWDAHAGYVTRAEWERVQEIRRTRAPHPSKPDHHPRRMHNPNNFLSGLLVCGVCGAKMTYGVSGARYVRCPNRVNHSCVLRTIAVNAVHGAVLDWMQQHIFTAARFHALRDEINAALNADRSGLQNARDALLTQAARLDAETRNLIEHIKRYGPDADIAAQIKNARAKKDRTRVELDQLEQQMTARRIIVSDDALDWLAAHLRDEIRHAAPERVRAVIHSIIARIAMHTDDTLHIAYSVQSLLRQWVSAQTVQRRGLLQSPAPLHTFPQWTADLETAELQIVRRRNVKHAAVAYA